MPRYSGARALIICEPGSNGTPFEIQAEKPNCIGELTFSRGPDWMPIHVLGIRSGAGRPRVAPRWCLAARRGWPTMGVEALAERAPAHRAAVNQPDVSPRALSSGVNGYERSDEIGIMADLQKLLFETRATVGDREILATARLNASVKAFAGQELTDDVIGRINHAIADEADRLIEEGVLCERPDWLAVIFRRRLYVAFGGGAVQQLSRDLKDMGAL
jgi:hypothetical protein